MLICWKLSVLLICVIVSDKIYTFQICEMKNCRKCIFFEAKKKQDLYMWYVDFYAAHTQPFVICFSENYYVCCLLELCTILTFTFLQWSHCKVELCKQSVGKVVSMWRWLNRGSGEVKKKKMCEDIFRFISADDEGNEKVQTLKKNWVDRSAELCVWVIQLVQLICCEMLK